jgi:hypothetical protein
LLAKKRLANVVIWTLEDIVGLCAQAQPEALAALQRAEEKMDPILIARLARIVTALSHIEIKATHARQGEYWDKEKARRGLGGLR